MTTYILLVKDEVKLAQFVELELSREGYQVSVTNDGMSELAISREMTDLELAISIGCCSGSRMTVI
jgi:DNA-binding response OmpR family regulator